MGDHAARTDLLVGPARLGEGRGFGTRRELLDLPSRGRPVAERVSAAGPGLTTTSAHLQRSGRGGPITGDRDGVTIRYRPGRPAPEYRACHIPAAISIPFHELADRLDARPIEVRAA